MPYSKGHIPKPLQGKNVPQKFADQWINVFNSVLKSTGDEGAAFRQANGVLAKSMHKAGYRQGQDKKWHKISKRTKEAQEFLAVPAMSLVFEEKSREQALQEGLEFTGVALVDHAVSQQGTGFERYYGPEANDRILQRTKEHMADLGHVVTIYNTHGSALGDFWSAGTNEDPIGKVVELWREDDEIRYRGKISATTHGKDQIQLIYDGIKGETSIRLYDADFDLCELVDGDGETTGETLYNMTDGYIGGIDFCDHAGIPGAGVHRLESAPQFHTVEDTDMEWESITLDELQEERSDLVNAIVADKLGILSKVNEDLQAKMIELEAREPDTEKIADLQGQLEVLGEKVAQAEARLKLAEASLGFVDRRVYEKLQQESPENPQKRAQELRDQALAELGAERAQGQGQAQFDNEPDVGDEGYPAPRQDVDAEDLGGDRVFAQMVRNIRKLS